jgi:uncharacterized membrane protein YcaP (DUF421 family)
MIHVVDNVLGLSLKSEELGYGQMAARTLVMYIALIVLVRLGKKRFLASATAFDYILVILIGSVAGRAMTGGSPYFPSILAMLVLIALHWIFSAVACRSTAFSQLIKGHATPLIHGGKLDKRALARAHMSADDLDEDLRDKGVRLPSEVEEARLERSGKLSVIKKGA